MGWGEKRAGAEKCKSATPFSIQNLRTRVVYFLSPLPTPSRIHHSRRRPAGTPYHLSVRNPPTMNLIELLRSRLRAAAYLSILLSPVGALAQPSPAPVTPTTTSTVSGNESDPVKMGEYVVAGMRKGLETSIETKRTAQVVMDSISSEDVGKFPDQNIAESLQRVNGVMIERTRGEGSRVSVRGLDPKFNSIKFNGRTLTSATGGRDFNFLLLQPEFVGALEVYKSASADMEEGALSATINYRTLRPLDIGSRRVVLNVEGSYEENARQWDPRVSAIYSDTLADGKVGIFFGVGHGKRRSETHALTGWGFEKNTESSANLDMNANGVIDGTAVRFDHAIYFNVYQPERERTNAVTTLQFKPTKALELYVDGLYAKSHEVFPGNDNALRFTNIVPNGPGAIKGATIAQIGGENYALHYDADGVDYVNNGRESVDDTRTYSVAGGFKWKGADRFRLEGEIARSVSQNLNSGMGLEVVGRAKASYDIQPDGNLPTVTFQRGFNPLDPNNFYAIGFNGPYKRPTKDSSTDARLDAHLDTDWGIFRSIDFGTKFSSRKHINPGWNPVQVSAEKMAELTGLPFIPNGIEGPMFSAAPFMTVVRPSSSFLSAVPNGNLAPQSWLSFSPDLLYQRVSLEKILATVPNLSTLNDSGNSIVKEDATAAYLKGNFKGKIGEIPYSGNIGVRAVRTEQTSDGFAPDFSLITFTQQGAVTNVPVSTYTVVKRKYTNVLPSANIVFNFPENLDVRFAAGRVISRPDLGLLSTSTNVNANERVINSTNPMLDPYEADQYDLSFEKYFGRGGLVTVTGFYKKIDSFVANARVTETHNVKQIDLGTTIPMQFDHAFPSNGAGANLQGVELGYQQPFTFLPKPFDGFGVLVNYTYVKSSTIKSITGGPALQLTGVSPHNYNVIAYYENRRFSARLAYNYRDGFLVDPVSSFGQGENVEPYHTLDATLNLRLNDKFMLTVNASNVTDEYQTRVTNYGIARSIEDNGRRFIVSLRATF
jgi:iron complex outermembrane receptor protein